MSRFPEKLRAAREHANLFQVQLGERIGVTQRSITDYEAGRAMPRPKTMRRLAEALNVTVEYLTNDAIDDPSYGRQREHQISEFYALLGMENQEIGDLLERSTALLSGEHIDQEVKDAFFDAIMEAYVACKKESRMRHLADTPNER